MRIEIAPHPSILRMWRFYVDDKLSEFTQEGGDLYWGQKHLAELPNGDGHADAIKIVTAILDPDSVTLGWFEPCSTMTAPCVGIEHDHVIYHRGINDAALRKDRERLRRFYKIKNKDKGEK